jgi:predicted DNA-binding transcriptional regulator YafY
MAISKHPFGRYQIIDRELGRRDYVKTKELKEIIERDLSVSVSERMINDDINAMRNNSVLAYNAPIEYCTSRKAYYYSDSEYTIRAFGLRSEDINALMFYAKTINQYKEYDIFKNFTNAIDKVIDAVNIRKGITNIDESRVMVLTDNLEKFSGNEWIPKIIEAINSNFMIELVYKKFGSDESKKSKLHPYLLKEDRHRWYLIGMNHKGIVTHGLDRILELNILQERFVPSAWDFENYFKHAIGITVEGEVNEVVLSFTPKQGDYLRALKIHPSQVILVDDKNEFRIKINVMPTWEFFEKILGYGESVEIISPSEIVNQFKERLQKISNKYK